MGHEKGGNVVFGMTLQGEWISIVLLGFPLVDGAHIGPAAIEVMASGFGITWEDEGVVFVEFVYYGREPMHVAIGVGCTNLWLKSQVKITGEEGFVSGVVIAGTNR